jgi:hypothetical protein
MTDRFWNQCTNFWEIVFACFLAISQFLLCLGPVESFLTLHLSASAAWAALPLALFLASASALLNLLLYYNKIEDIIKKIKEPDNSIKKIKEPDNGLWIIFKPALGALPIALYYFYELHLNNMPLFGNLSMACSMTMAVSFWILTILLWVAPDPESEEEPEEKKDPKQGFNSPPQKVFSMLLVAGSVLSFGLTLIKTLKDWLALPALGASLTPYIYALPLLIALTCYILEDGSWYYETLKDFFGKERKDSAGSYYFYTAILLNAIANTLWFCSGLDTSSLGLNLSSLIPIGTFLATALASCICMHVKANPAQKLKEIVGHSENNMLEGLMKVAAAMIFTAGLLISLGLVVNVSALTMPAFLPPTLMLGGVTLFAYAEISLSNTEARARAKANAKRKKHADAATQRQQDAPQSSEKLMPNDDVTAHSPYPTRATAVAAFAAAVLYGSV